jgi:hypothetical protein
MFRFDSYLHKSQSFVAARSGNVYFNLTFVAAGFRQAT